jgi:tetratricopeptide (TPR) repeat protein
MIDQADLLVDEGAIDDAFKLFDRVDARLKDHPLAVLGRSMARAEAQLDLTTAMDDLSVKLDKPLGPRVAAYRQLALALAQYGLEDYPHALEALRKATAGSHPPGEPRFWSRVAWTQFSRGGLADAATARAHVTWYSKHPEDDPSVVLVDAGLLLASGRPDAALDMASKIDGVRPRLLRAYAMLDLGKAKDALDEAEEALKKAPENAEAEILRQWAKLVSSSGKAREESAEALEKLARRAKSKLGRHALGMAYLAVGDAKQAQPQLEFALADITDDSPNPLEYRTRTAMAQILLEAGDVPGATKQLEGALKANSGYFPARATQAKVLLKAGDADQALALLAPLASEPGGMTPAATLTLAEAMVTRKGATADDKAKATELLTTIKDKVQPASELARVAALIDPKLPEQLGLGSAGPADAPKAPKAPPRRGRR